MNKTFNVVIEKDSDGFYVASVPYLHGCHTQAKSIDILLERIKEAIELWFEVNESFSLNEFVGIQRVAVAV